MKIACESPEVLAPIANLFAHYTSGAEICVNDIRYDAANGVVEIPMKRNERIERERKKKGCLLDRLSSYFLPPYVYGTSWFDSVLTIRQVEAMKIDVDDLLVEKCNSCFTIMMGVLIENNEVYLCSLEEASGKTLCHIDISVKGLNIELADRT